MARMHVLLVAAVVAVLLAASACTGTSTSDLPLLDAVELGADTDPTGEGPNQEETTGQQGDKAPPADADAPTDTDPIADQAPVAQRMEGNPGAPEEGQHWIGWKLMTDTSIELVWATGTAGAEPSRYRVYRVDRSASGAERRATDELLVSMALTEDLLVFDSADGLLSTTWTDLRVETGQYYSYLLSVDVGGMSLARRWTTAVALTDTQPPSPITGLRAELDETSNEVAVLLSWDLSTDNVAFSSYAVSLVAPAGELEYLGGGDDNQKVAFLDTTPPPGVVTYAVQAVDFHNNRTQPAMVTVDTSLAPEVSDETVRRGEVQFVFDGDSFDVLFEDGAFDDDFPSTRGVRLLGINAPEETECYAEESRALVQPFTLQELEVQGDDVDSFGRLLAYAWDVSDGQVQLPKSLTGPNESGTLNEWLVLEGAAVARSSFGHAWEDAFEAAEALAKEQQVGMWSPGKCGSAAVARITKVWFDAPGRDNENPNGEWIHIVNSGTDDLDLTGWLIRDESTRHRFRFPDGTRLAVQETVQVFSGCDSSSTDPAPTDVRAGLAFFWCDPDGPVWSNSGDTAFLLDAGGNTVDTESWESIYDDE